MKIRVVGVHRVEQMDEMASSCIPGVCQAGEPVGAILT